MSSIEMFLHVLTRRDSEIRKDARYWPHYYSRTSSVTAKAFDYIPHLIQYKVYHHDSPQHRLVMCQKNPVAKYLVFDVPKMMFKDFFHFEDDEKKEIMKEKIHMLLDMGAKEALTLAAIFERLDGWSYLIYFDSEHPRYDAELNAQVFDAMAPGEAQKIRAFPETAVTVLDFDLSGFPTRIKVEVNLENETKHFVVDDTRFSLVRTRPYDSTYKGVSILEPIWDPIVLDTWVTFCMGERAAREGAGYKHVKFPEEYITDKTSLQNLAAKFQGLASSKGAFTTEKVEIDEKGYGHTQVNWNVITDVLLDRIAIGSGYPRDILKGIQSGRVTGGEVNEKGVYAALNECQVDFNPVIKDMNRKVFRNMKQKFYNVRHNLTFRMTEKDRAETEKIKADTKSVQLSWMEKNEIREKEGLPPIKEEKPQAPPPDMQQQLPQKLPQKLLPAPEEKKDSIPATSDDDCVSKKIKWLKEHEPGMSHEQMVAIATEYCKKKSKGDFKVLLVEGNYRFDYFEEPVGNIQSNGKELIVPIVLAQEGVYPYDEEGTKELVTYEELVKAAKYSPSLPIILDSHHTMSVSGMDVQYGVVTNIRGDHKRKRLVGDGHFFIDKTPKEYLDLLKNKRKIEGSVGKYIGTFGGAGEFLGEYYDTEQKDIKMMHYAVSNKFTGKCSTQMGCGVNQT